MLINSKHLLAACLVATAMLLVNVQLAAAQAAVRIAPTQKTVILLQPHGYWAKPVLKTRRLGIVSDVRPITKSATVLPVLTTKVDPDGRVWLKVRMPGRTLHGRIPPPTAWISGFHTEESITPWHVLVTRSARQMTLYKYGKVFRRFPVIVGKPSTPTPTGRFFVEETLTMPYGAPGGPFAMATNARSRVLQEFEGGPGQIAIHGRNFLRGALGTAASHGCVRMDNRDVAWLVQRADAGTPVTIV